MAKGKLYERWMRLRNFQSRDFWAMLFARPLTILFLLPIADRKWLTPNRISLLSFLVKVAGTILVAFFLSYPMGVLGAILLNLGLILDNMDGTLARYRGNGTPFGYYLDKMLDAVGFVPMFWAMAYRGYQKTGDVTVLILPIMGISAVYVTNYSKWVADRVLTDITLKKLKDKPRELAEWIKKRTTPSRGSIPPKRSLWDWVKWFLYAIVSILFFNEVDFFFWAGVSLILDNYYVFAYYSLFLIGGLFAGPILYLTKILKAEKEAK